jgi:hypothetical protein
MVMLQIGVIAAESEGIGQLSTDITQKEPAPKVTSVYGISSDDYLPSVETARKTLRPQVRRSGSRPSFDLPDAFYFIGGPIFLILFLRVLIIFLNGFEEKRIEEQRMQNSQPPPEVE